MYLKLFFKKLFNPYDFTYIHTSDYYLNLFYDDLVTLDTKICLEHDKNYVNHLLFFSDYNAYTLKFRDCLESAGLKVKASFYALDNEDKGGILFTVYLDNIWELL